MRFVCVMPVIRVSVSRVSLVPAPPGVFLPVHPRCLFTGTSLGQKMRKGQLNRHQKLSMVEISEKVAGVI